jgi:hypothetical protein
MMSDRKLNAQATGADDTHWMLRIADDGSVDLGHNGEPFARIAATDALDLYRRVESPIPRMRSLLEALEHDGGSAIDERAHAALMNNAKWLDDRFG